MSKYGKLWEYIRNSGKSQLELSFFEIGEIAGVPLDHSFLQCKKELFQYGYEVEKISMKVQTVLTEIYRISRNPSFLGFDLLYIGLLISFFNYIHLAFVVFAVVMLHLLILQEEKFLTATFGEKYVGYKRRTGRYFIFGRNFSKKKTVAVCLAVIICVSGAIGGFVFYGTNKMKRLSELSFKQSLEYITKNNPDAVITVGIIKDGQISYKVYGKNGAELASKPYVYEIGSLTKTFTAALVNKWKNRARRKYRQIFRLAGRQKISNDRRTFNAHFGLQRLLFRGSHDLQFSCRAERFLRSRQDVCA